jgi:transporter family-2 protein
MLAANGALQEGLGPFQALLAIHLVGLASVVPLLWIVRERPRRSGPIPWYLFTAGLLGVALLFINNRTIVSLGATLTVSLGILGQLAASSVIDHFGMFGLERRPFRWTKLPGHLLILAGLVVMALPQA